MIILSLSRDIFIDPFIASFCIRFNRCAQIRQTRALQFFQRLIVIGRAFSEIMRIRAEHEFEIPDLVSAKRIRGDKAAERLAVYLKSQVRVIEQASKSHSPIPRAIYISEPKNTSGMVSLSYTCRSFSYASFRRLMNRSFDSRLKSK